MVWKQLVGKIGTSIEIVIPPFSVADVEKY